MTDFEYCKNFGKLLSNSEGSAVEYLYNVQGDMSSRELIGIISDCLLIMNKEQHNRLIRLIKEWYD